MKNKEVSNYSKIEQIVIAAITAVLTILTMSGILFLLSLFISFDLLFTVKFTVFLNTGSMSIFWTQIS